MKQQRLASFVLILSVLMMMFSGSVFATEQLTADEVLALINEAQSGAQLQQIIEINASTLGLDMTKYNMLSLSGKRTVIQVIAEADFNSIADLKMVFEHTAAYEEERQNNGGTGTGGGGGEGNPILTSDFAVGDYVYFGRYWEDPILWRVININNDGSVMLYSEKILCVKPFDANGDTTDGRDDEIGSREQSGSNNWEKSNLREWLNSEESNVIYSHQVPDNDHVYEGLNNYDNEAGFLNGFSQLEREVIQPYNHRVVLSQYDTGTSDGGNKLLELSTDIGTIDQAYNSAYYKDVMDQVFLLDLKEVHDYIYNRGWEYRRAPTDKAVIDSQYTYQPDEDYWSNWLSTPHASKADVVLRIDYTGDVDIMANAFNRSGVSPALNIKPGISVQNGDGTIESPYVVTGDREISFPDSNLETAIREAIDKPTGEIYKSDIDGFFYLNLSSKNISDIEGLQHFRNLKGLNLSGNRISNISPLNSLIGLTDLDLQDNYIELIHIIGSLVNLEYLYLTSNEIVEIYPLDGLRNLKCLSLSNNCIDMNSGNENSLTIQNLQSNNPEVILTYLNQRKPDQVYSVADGFKDNEHFRINVTKWKDITDSGTLYFVTYDSNNRLNKVEMQTVDIDERQSTTFSTNMTIPEDGKLKVFIWRGINEIKPLSNVFIWTANN